jgi:hypothetical protein
MEYQKYEETSHLNWIKNRYEQSEKLRSLFIGTDHAEWLLSLPTYIEREEFILVHGGLHPSYGLDTPTEIATMIRVIE